MNQQNLSSFIWSVADLLRGDYKQSEYGKVILPFTVLRRLDCVLEPSKEAVLAEREKREAAGLNPEPFLLKKSGLLFYNTSPLDIKKLMGDQDNIAENMFLYIQAFSPAVRDCQFAGLNRPRFRGLESATVVEVGGLFTGVLRGFCVGTRFAGLAGFGLIVCGFGGV